MYYALTGDWNVFCRRVLDELCLDSDPVIDTDPVIVAFHELSVTFTAKFNKAYDIKPTEL